MEKDVSTLNQTKNIVSEPNDVFNTTVDALNNLSDNFDYFKNKKNEFNEGESKISLKKKFLLKSIDERWVNIIEDTLPYMDTIIRNPGGGLIELEELRPVELTRKVTSKAVIHLSQHTDLINDITPDGMVKPSKLLNVYNEETILTYENRFLNTLLLRVYSFVMIRYDAAIACGEDEKNTTLTYSQEFGDELKSGKIDITLQLSERPKGKYRITNYLFTSDLWKRVEKIVKFVKSLMGSEFVKTMGKNYILPPVMRTNKLQKNVEFKQCLTLWEFLEQYDSTGYETLVQESLERPSKQLINNICNAATAEYLLFEKGVSNSIDEANQLDAQTSDIFNPTLVEELEKFNPDEYDYKTIINDEYKTPATLSEEEKNVDLALEVALNAYQKLHESDILDSFGYVYRYNYSFIARLITGEKTVQDLYFRLKGLFGSYKNVTSSISWRFEDFYYGKTLLARIEPSGKSLRLYLPIEEEHMIGKKIRWINVLAKRPFYPLPIMLKVANENNLAIVEELLAVLAIKNNIKQYSRTNKKTYAFTEMSVEELCKTNPPLIHQIGKYGVSYTKESMENMDINPYIKEVEIPKYEYVTKYTLSHTAKIIKAKPELQDAYSKIKNTLMSYSKVVDDSNFDFEVFTRDDLKLCKLEVKSIFLNIYLNLNLENVLKYNLKFSSVDDGTYTHLLRISNNKHTENIIQLINDSMKELNIHKRTKFEEVDYHYEDKSIEELENMGEDLVKEEEVRVRIKKDNE